MAATDTPASAGEHGPGDTTSRVTPEAMSSPICATVISSLRCTCTSAPNSPKYWTML